MANEYRTKAAELAAKAQVEKNPFRRAQFEALEQSYLRLATQADKNAANDIVYETPPRPPPDLPAAQQQQQRQRKKRD